MKSSRISISTLADLLALLGLAVGSGLVLAAFFGLLVGIGGGTTIASISWLCVSLWRATK